MATITPRTRKDGSIGYTAQIRVKRGGRIVHNEARTFDREAAARAWAKKRERELDDPGALESAQKEDPPLSDAIDRYRRESKRDIGRTKSQVLNTIAGAAIGKMRCSEINSQQIIQFAQSLDVKPQTAGNYISHLAAVFQIARPAWGYPLDMGAMDDARKVMKRLGTTSKSDKRERRPTLDEIHRTMEHFFERQVRKPSSAPMPAIVGFAIFSTRRLNEIVGIEWRDFDEAGSRVLVRDMKHPGQKVGNDVWCDLPYEALRIIRAQPRRDKRIFPYGDDAVSTAFTRAMKVLGIEDLHLHDMRHEGTSRLFEMSLNIPHVAAVTGHRSWTSLKRYTHLRHTGDKFANWRWLDVIAPLPQRSSTAI